MTRFKDSAFATTALACAFVSSGALAADADTAILKAVEPIRWVHHGVVEVGGRFYIERAPKGFARFPDGNFLTPPFIDSRAKFEEYRDLRPGPFGNIAFGAFTTDYLYQLVIATPSAVGFVKGRSTISDRLSGKRSRRGLKACAARLPRHGDWRPCAG